jgi:monoamine oxidase
MQNLMLPGLSRRYFLEQLGRVGGAAAVTLAMNAFGIPTATALERPPELRGSGKGKKVLVLGAGHAGNASAYELSKLGYKVTVLEARGFAGGRAQTARKGFKAQEMGGEAAHCEFDDGLYINIGPWRIPYHHRATLHYTKEFGVPLEIMVNDNDHAFVYARNGKGALAGKPVRQAEIKADARGYASEIVAKAAASGKLEGMISSEDKDIFLEYLRHEGYLTPDFSYKGTDGRGWKVHPGAGLIPGVESEPHAFSDVFNSQLWRHFNSVTEIDMQWTMFQPVGGMDQIARGFERHMGHLISYNTEVERIRQNANGVTADWVNTKTGRRGSATADYVICTIPLSVLHRLDTDFSDSYREAMEGVAYAPVMKAGLQMKRRFWEEDFAIYGGHIKSDHNNGYGGYTISLPSTGWQSKKGVLLGAYLFGDVAVQTSALSLKDRIETCLDVGEEIFPGLYRANYEKAFSWCWHRAKYSQGGWAEWSQASRAKHYPTLLQPEGRIYLAGEHLSYMTGWQCGAFESAWQQIEKLHNHAQQAQGI